MVRERIADDIYVFTSQRYAQVTAGAILTREGAILIDTLFYPEETQAIREFITGRLGVEVRYLVNTHYHADHTIGTYLFPEAQVISHTLCRQLLDTTGREGLQQMKAQSPEFAGAEIVLPELIFSTGALNIYLGDKTVRLMPCPGHSRDLICASVVGDRVLFASDTVMPVPTLFDGDYDQLVESLTSLLDMGLNCVVRGHGEVVLRGEVNSLIRSDLAYLRKIRREVENVVERGKPASALEKISIESCGKSRISLNGLVTDLHQANLRKLYRELNHKQD